MAAMRFAFKHAVATIVLTAASVALTVVSYFGFLAWAAVAGQGIGGPLALPFVILLALLAALACVMGALLPVTALADVITSRVFHWHRLAQIPVSGSLLLAYVVGLGIVVGLACGATIERAATAAIPLAVVLLVPLGLYWWCLQSTDLVVGLASGLFQRALGRGGN
jgi:hypothetical protein